MKPLFIEFMAYSIMNLTEFVAASNKDIIVRMFHSCHIDFFHKLSLINKTIRYTIIEIIYPIISKNFDYHVKQLDTNETLFANVKYMLRWMHFHGIENITKYLIGIKFLEAKTTHGKNLEKLYPQYFYLCDIIIDLILYSIRTYNHTNSYIIHYIGIADFIQIKNNKCEEFNFRVSINENTLWSYNGSIKFNNNHLVINFTSSLFGKPFNNKFLIIDPLFFVIDRNIKIKSIPDSEDPFI